MLEEEIKAKEEELDAREKKLNTREENLSKREIRTPTSQDVKDSKEFYLKEYEGLRAEILQVLTQSRSLERDAVIAVGLSVVWLASHKVNQSYRFIWYMPFLLAAFASYRSLVILWSFNIYAKYIRDVEKAFSSSQKPAGWDTFHQKKSLGIGLSAGFFWVVLMGVSWYAGHEKPSLVNDPPCPQVIIQPQIVTPSLTPKTDASVPNSSVKSH